MTQVPGRTESICLIRGQSPARKTVLLGSTQPSRDSGEFTEPGGYNIVFGKFDQQKNQTARRLQRAWRPAPSIPGKLPWCPPEETIDARATSRDHRVV